jgi:gas vesicle protein
MYFGATIDADESVPIHAAEHRRCSFRYTPAAVSRTMIGWEFIMHRRSEYGGSFLMGLITGSVIGAGLVTAFAPDLRKRLKTSGADLRDAVSDGYQEAGARIAGVVDDVVARGQAIRDNVADAVGRGAREGHNVAMASKTR